MTTNYYHANGKHSTLGYLPLFWLAYLVFFFFKYWWVDATGIELAKNALIVGAFIPLHFYCFVASDKQKWLIVAATTALGFYAASYNVGASTLFVYASAMSSTFDRKYEAIAGILSVVVVAIIAGFVFQMPPLYFTIAVPLCIIIGILSIYDIKLREKNYRLRELEKERAHFATEAERERMARDVHDTVGHVISTVTLKSELVRKLIGKDDNKAREEIAEIESISRQALKEIRAAIANHQTIDFNQELKNAQTLLKYAQVDLECSLDSYAEIDQGIMKQLAFILRESTNNILKHSSGDRCTIELSINEHELRLVITDNGKATPTNEGTGLIGIRQRVELLQGSYDVAMKNDGFSITVTAPLQPGKALND